MKKTFFPLFIRVSSQLISFIIPLLVLNYFSTEIYGVLVILIGLQALNALSDWGKQIPYQNRISQIGLTKYNVIGWLFIRNKFKRHLIINLFIGVLAIYTYPYWINLIIKDGSNYILANFKPSFNYIVITSSIYGILYGADSLLMGLGQVKKKYTLDFLSASLVLIVLIILIAIKANIVYILNCAVSVPIVMRVVSTVYVVLNRNNLQRNDYLGEVLDKNSRQSISRLSIMFFYLQLLSLLANNIDSLYLSNNINIGLIEIGKYGFYIKIFSISILLINLLNTIKAPEISSKAHSITNKFAFPILRKIITTNILISIVSSVLVLITMGAFLEIIHKPEMLDYPMALSISAQTLVSSVRNSLTVFINSAELMLHNLLGNTFFSFLQVPLKIFLINKFTVYGIPLSNIMGYLLLLFPFHFIALYYHRKNFKNQQ